jgi:hypothetical protein
MNEPRPNAAALSVAERDRRCRNCGADVSDAFCPHCGQETALRLPTLREFMREAAGRYVAFDGRFWRTMGALLLRPGFLTRAYLAGRRRRYIRPVRLYLFSTLIFFAVSRFFVEPAGLPTAQTREPAGGSAASSDAAGDDKAQAERMSEDAFGAYLDKDLSLRLPGKASTSLEKRWESFNEMPRHEKEDQIVAGMLRYGPYAMFALLPAFALLLKVLYIGRRRRYPARPRLYGEHMVFAAHNHAFLFAMATVILLISVPAVRDAMAVWLCAYLLWAMHAVYGGSWFGVIARSFVLFVIYSVLVGMASAGLLIAAIFLR